MKAADQWAAMVDDATAWPTETMGEATLDKVKAPVKDDTKEDPADGAAGDDRLSNVLTALADGAGAINGSRGKTGVVFGLLGSDRTTIYAATEQDRAEEGKGKGERAGAHFLLYQEGGVRLLCQLFLFIDTP